MRGAARPSAVAERLEQVAESFVVHGADLGRVLPPAADRLGRRGARSAGAPASRRALTPASASGAGAKLRFRMRIMFFTYLVFLLAGTTYFIVIGLTHH
jgi:hypothetical protein